jgi:2-oxo-3-hexenedioate decarboxylase
MEIDEAALADEISRARSERRTIAGRRGVLDLDAAYRVQRRRFDGLTIVGAKMVHAGPAGLVHGPVVPEMLLEEPVVDLDAFLQPHVRPELATVLSADVAAQAEPGDIACALPGVFLAVDVVDTIWADYEAEVAEAVADGVGGGAFLLGEQLLPLHVTGEVRLRVNGDVVGAASLSSLGDPVTRVGWLATEVGGLRAGAVVFLGSLAAHVATAPGTLLLEGPRGATLSAVLRSGAQMVLEGQP